MFETTCLERYLSGKRHFFLISVKNKTLEVRRGVFGAKGERLFKSCRSRARTNLDAVRCVNARLEEGYQHTTVKVAKQIQGFPYTDKAELPTDLFGGVVESSAPVKKKIIRGRERVAPAFLPTEDAWNSRSLGRAWRIGKVGEPPFPEDFEVVKRAVLQRTNISNNNNKYYAIELHRAGKRFRVFTHYGRTDDLEGNPEAGVREGRYFLSKAEAESSYKKIYAQKTSSKKGYQEVHLASSRIGSQKSRGQSSGHVDGQTLAKAVKKTRSSKLSPAVQELVTYLYDEATSALTATINAKITARGIETPLGVLTLGQIEKGEVILEALYAVFKRKKRRPGDAQKMVALSGDFYTAIPHRLGRSRAAVAAAVINTLEDFEQKQETLQLMKDMLQVSSEDAGVLFGAEVDKKYDALGCEIVPFSRRSATFKEIAEFVEGSQVRSKKIKVKNVFAVSRGGEAEAFDQGVGNERRLFHGSRIKNWVGILSRGILLPRIVTSMGLDRTDEGWLGHGIYFGSAACTGVYYTSPGKKKTRFMTVASVALGKIKPYNKITYGLTAPPKGYDSCHGVRSTAKNKSEFADDEFVVYRGEQQKLEYLIEFTS